MYIYMRSVEVRVPAGRLGITFASRRGGPIVHSLLPDSPVEAKIGWRLLAVDGTLCGPRCTANEAAAKLSQAQGRERLLRFDTHPLPPWTLKDVLCFCGIDAAIVVVTTIWLTCLAGKVPLALLLAWFACSACGLYHQWSACQSTGLYTTAESTAVARGDKEALPTSLDASLPACDKCNLAKPRRARHCSTCERCIPGFDHHCFFVGACVGEANYATF